MKEVRHISKERGKGDIYLEDVNLEMVVKAKGISQSTQV